MNMHWESLRLLFMWEIFIRNLSVSELGRACTIVHVLMFACDNVVPIFSNDRVT